MANYAVRLCTMLASTLPREHEDSPIQMPQDHLQHSHSRLATPAPTVNCPRRQILPKNQNRSLSPLCSGLPTT
jgi:hypothetical protein